MGTKEKAGREAGSDGEGPGEALEPLPGSVVAQYITCGKAECRCQTGDRHGPYHYRVWREDGRVRKVYVTAAALERVKAQCDLHRSMSLRLREIVAARVALTRDLQEHRRTTARLLRKHGRGKLQALRGPADRRA